MLRALRAVFMVIGILAVAWIVLTYIEDAPSRRERRERERAESDLEFQRHVEDIRRTSELLESARQLEEKRQKWDEITKEMDKLNEERHRSSVHSDEQLTPPPPPQSDRNTYGDPPPEWKPGDSLLPPFNFPR